MPAAMGYNRINKRCPLCSKPVTEGEPGVVFGAQPHSVPGPRGPVNFPRSLEHERCRIEAVAFNNQSRRAAWEQSEAVLIAMTENMRAEGSDVPVHTPRPYPYTDEVYTRCPQPRR